MAIAFNGKRALAPTQRAVDLWNAARHLDKEIQRIKPLDAA